MHSTRTVHAPVDNARLLELGGDDQGELCRCVQGLPGQHDRLELRRDALEHAPLRLSDEELLLILRLQRVPLDALIAGALDEVLVFVHQAYVER